MDLNEKRLNQVIADKDKEHERDKGLNKLKIQKLESKIEKKKDKIKSMINDFQEKDNEIERMREELDSLRGKIKQLNKKIKDEKKMRMEFELKSQVIQQQKSKSALMNQECDFEDCIDEECVEPAQTNKS